MVMPLKLPALTVFFNNGEQWEVDDPLKDPNTLSAKPAQPTNLALINYKEGSVAKISRRDQYEVIIIHKFNEVVGLIWPDPTQLSEAQNTIHQGDLTRGLAILDPILKAIEPWPRTPGSWWLKANLLKLSALEKLRDPQRLERVIFDLAKHDAGNQPTLSTSLSIAQLTLLNCQGDPQASLKGAEILLPKLANPEDIARVNFCQGQANLLLKNYEAALSFFLRISAFQGARSEQYAQVLLGIVRALRGLENPAIKDEKIHATTMHYLRRIISECPLSAEAAIAQSLLNQESTTPNPIPKT